MSHRTFTPNIADNGELGLKSHLDWPLSSADCYLLDSAEVAGLNFELNLLRVRSLVATSNALSTADRCGRPN